MIVRAGYQTFEFQQAYELPKPLGFESTEDALKWLRQLWSQYPEMIVRFREYLSRYSVEQDAFRLTDQQTVERLAALLYSRKIVVVARENRSGGPPTAKVQAPAPAFPLSERKRRAPSASSGSSSPSSSTTPTPVLAPLWIRLDLTPKQAAKQTGSLQLVGSSGGYDRTLAIASSFVPNQVEANTVDVLFENVPITADYTLTYIDAAGAKTTVVENAPFSSLKDDSMTPSAPAPAAAPADASSDDTAGPDAQPADSSATDAPPDPPAPGA